MLKQELSNRELEVAVHVKSGKSNKAIAESLFITEKTVKFHLTSIFRKERVKSRAQLMVKMVTAGADFDPLGRLQPEFTSRPAGAAFALPSLEFASEAKIIPKDSGTEGSCDLLPAGI